MERRTDRLSALYVDAVLNVCQREDRDSAVVILLDHGLRLDTVMRLVNAQNARRRTRLDEGPCRSACQQTPQLGGLVGAERVAEQAADQWVVDHFGMREVAFGLGVE
jgi:hypothetical protein